VPGISTRIYTPGPFRLFRPVIAEQVGWLLVPAILALLLLLWRWWKGNVTSEQKVSYVFWGGWLLVAGGFFSFARFYHLYYLVVLAPAIAALAGIAIAALWEEFRSALWGERRRRVWN